jgi:hypothetical protein
MTTGKMAGMLRGLELARAFKGLTLVPHLSQ